MKGAYYHPCIKAIGTRYNYADESYYGVVFKDVAQLVRPGELLAEIQTIFGDMIEQIFAPDFDAVVVGVEGNPVAKAGNRVVGVK